MATFHVNIACANPSGSTSFKVKYRLNGDPAWTVFSIAPPPSSGTTATIPQDSPAHVLLDNRIYNVQIQNINGVDNPLSLIWSDIGFTAPDTALSPSSTSIGFSFDNLSEDITSYLVQLTTAADPGTVIRTQTITPGTYPETESGNFTGLTPLTAYRLVITSVAGTFASDPFIFLFATLASGGCPDVSNVVATITTQS